MPLTPARISLLLSRSGPCSACGVVVARTEISRRRGRPSPLQNSKTNRPAEASSWSAPGARNE